MADNEFITINTKKLNESFSKIPKHNWAIATYLLSILIVITLIYSNAGFTITGKTISENQIENFVNNELLQTGTAEITSLEKQSGVYKATISYQGQSIPLYFTTDGKFINTGTELTSITNLGTTETQESEIVDVSEDNDAVKGDPDAPVTIIEFSDYECPFCGKHYKETYKQIESNYIETGKVKYVMRDFPLTRIHPDAQKASEAAECAGEQDKYWEMHDKLFENQESLSVSNLKQYASQIGLDTTQFNECLDSGKYEQEVKDDLADGQAAGVSGTPAFFINGKMLSGAQPYSAFEAEIESALNEQ